MIQLFEKIGEWNPQFTREIKGRLKIFPILVTSAISLIVQAVILVAQLGQLPDKYYRINGEYCGLGTSYQEQISDLNKVITKLQNNFYHYNSEKYFDAEKVDYIQTQIKEVENRRSYLQNILNKPCPPSQIDMAHWWRDHWEYIFQGLSVIFIVSLLVAGTFLLINNLVQEERRGTLNFIRLSPQSETSILTGKILGVPILIYLFVALAIPLHIFSGKAAGIAFSHILGYYTVLAGSCVFFFSASLLFSLTTPILRGFQPWLGAGTVLMFLSILFTSVRHSDTLLHGAAWFRMLAPVDLTGYLFPNFLNNDSPNRWQRYKELQFFYIPIGTNIVNFIGIHLASYTLWTYGIWQGLIRRFRNPNTPVINKQQSYLLVALVQILLWGFTLQTTKNFYPRSSLEKIVQGLYDINEQILSNLPIFAIFNFAILLGLIFILSQERQTVQDWARYRHTASSKSKSWWHKSLLRDLIFGEKSPALVALALNSLIMAIPVAVWVTLCKQLNVHDNNVTNWIIKDVGELKVILGIVLLVLLWAIGATIAQQMLLLKTSKRYLWAIGTTSALLFAPAFILAILNNTISKNSVLWLFTIYPWEGMVEGNFSIAFLSLFTQLTVLGFLMTRLIQQIRLVSKS
jgi:hypothetical protein